MPYTIHGSLAANAEEKVSKGSRRQCVVLASAPQHWYILFAPLREQEEGHVRRVNISPDASVILGT